MYSDNLIFIVDSYFGTSLHRDLEDLGLKREKDYVVTGAGGASQIFHNIDGQSMIDSPNLLVFMSTFHGVEEPAIEISEKIKETNPNCRIFFRTISSIVGPSNNAVFDGSIDKEDYDGFLSIIRQHLRGIPVEST